MKRVIILTLIFLISLSFVSASNYSKTDALDWLSTTNIQWGTAPIEEISFTLLALDSNDYDTTGGLNFLKSRKDTAGCYPSGSCTSKDTALATLALSELGEDVTVQLNWLNDTLKKADISGDWMIQIIPGSGEGECNFTGAGNSIIKEIEEASEWFSIENDLGMIINDPLETINIDCDLSSNTKISLLRKTTEYEFYIIQEKTGNNVDLIVNSACYAQIKTGTCHPDSSFYVSWVLENLNEEVNIIPYLQDAISSNSNNIYYSILNKVSSTQEYVDTLISNQNTAGYWEYTTSNIYGTSFAIDSLYSSPVLPEVTTAINWLEEQQVDSGVSKGSWGDGSVLDTATAVYLGLTHAYIGGQLGNPSGFCGDGYVQSLNLFGEFEECDDGNDIDNDLCDNTCKLTEGIECTSDDQCTNVGEICNLEANICEIDPNWCTDNYMCDSGTICDTSINTCVQPFVYCEDEDDCEFYQDCNPLTNLCETSPGYCSTDLDCFGNTVCDFLSHICIPQQPDDYDYTDTDSEADTKASYWWIWLIIIIIIMAGVIFAYFKFSKPKKPKGGPSFLGDQKPREPPRQQQYQPPKQFTRAPRDEQLERELDKSIKEAQDMLRKK